MTDTITTESCSPQLSQ